MKKDFRGNRIIRKQVQERDAWYTHQVKRWIDYSHLNKDAIAFKSSQTERFSVERSRGGKRKYIGGSKRKDNYFKPQGKKSYHINTWRLYSFWKIDYKIQFKNVGIQLEYEDALQIFHSSLDYVEGMI